MTWRARSFTASGRDSIRVETAYSANCRVGVVDMVYPPCSKAAPHLDYSEGSDHGFGLMSGFLSYKGFIGIQWVLEGPMAAQGGQDSQQTGPDFAETFTQFSAQLDVSRLPESVVRAVKANLYDTLACSIAGISAPGVAEVLDLVVGWGGAPQASILCSDHKVPAHHAALINGMMAHARDYDDTHDAAVLHAGVSVVPAALAAAELSETASGADLIAGVAAGLELICRLGVATRIGIIESGFIYTSLFGYFAATAAAARVLRLDARQSMNAIGIVYSQAAGTHQVTRDAATTKRMQPGFAAKAALISVQLAQREIRGAQQSFEGLDGLFRTYLRGSYAAEILRADLGSRFELEGLSYKPYPCCRFNHTAIDAALLIRQQPGFRADRIKKIKAYTNHQAYEAVCTPPDIRRAPKTIVQAQFSIPYNVACALIDGQVGLRHFTPEGMTRADVLSLAQHVECQVDAEIEREWGRTISPTFLQVETDDGQFEARVNDPRGHATAPMTRQDFEAKLQDCLHFSGRVWPAGLAQDFDRCIQNLEHEPRAARLVELLKN
ncbi:MAG: MmgE/PrpD family protein [Alphaproteobacteria bacterium]|nr:MmgE/PrpD family protein [Alphaproteobacteria bacterium]